MSGGSRSLLGRALTDPHPGLVAATCAIILVWFTVAFARDHGGDLSSLVCFGDRFIPADELPAGTWVTPDSTGYDGQFFYCIARDPLARGAWHVYVDEPAYRYHRILYPLLASALALGCPAAIPVTLVLVNLLAITAGTWLVACFLQRHSRSPWMALSFGLLSGMFLALFRDLSDAVAIVALVGALVAHEAHRPRLTALALAAALLTREFMGIAVPILVLDLLWRRRDCRAAFTVALAVLPLLLWNLHLHAVFGRLPWSNGASAFGPPFEALCAYGLRVYRGGVDLAGGAGREHACFWLTLASALVLLPLALLEVMRRRDALAILLVGFSLMPIILSRHLWVEPWSYGRILMGGPALAVLAYARGGSRFYAIPLALQGLLTVATLRWQHVL